MARRPFDTTPAKRPITGMVTGIGLIGCGRIAELFHIPILSRMADVALHLSDTDAARLAKAGASAKNPRLHASPEALIADTSVPAVVLCVPPALHAPLAIAAFAAGKHVYVEKPLALTAADGASVAASWRAAGTVGMIGFNFRHHPAYLDLKSRIGRGDLGEVMAVRTLFTAASRTIPDWKRDAATGGGALRDLGTHHLDLVPWLLGSPVRRVMLLEQSRKADGDVALLMVELEGGIAAQVMLSSSAGAGENRIEVIGTKGRVVADTSFAMAGAMQRGGGRVARLMRLGRSAQGHLQPRRILAQSPPEPSFERALGAFVTAVRGGGGGSPGIEDGQRSLLAVEAAGRSMASGRFELVEHA